MPRLPIRSCCVYHVCRDRPDRALTQVAGDYRRMGKIESMGKRVNRIHLYGGDNIETGLFHSKRETTRASVQIDCYRAVGCHRTFPRHSHASVLPVCDRP
ncbi:hypothetical protein MDOR_01550 [Mycolicibacterium doricum]|uniref:Uncharacterized protein n=1 Tax=Mycolicibacterium doricum TaxID=126673 RepID=A0A7I7VKZ4_9MYCO|nr:hypothetical protein MDOR_01550 [Mycolicibacterium doricum]